MPGNTETARSSGFAAAARTAGARRFAATAGEDEARPPRSGDPATARKAGVPRVARTAGNSRFRRFAAARATAEPSERAAAAGSRLFALATRSAAGVLAAAFLAVASDTAAGQTPEEQAAPVLSARERRVRVVALEDARSFGDGWLFDRVSDPDHEVRRQTALALGRIGRPEAVTPLLQFLADDRAGAVRAAAAFALGILEDPLPEEAVAALEAALADPAGLVREKAVEAFGRRGGPRPRPVAVAEVPGAGEVVGAGEAAAGGETASAAETAGTAEVVDAAEISGAEEMVSAGEIVGTVLRERLEASGYAGRREDVETSMRRTGWDEARFALFSLARLADDGRYADGDEAAFAAEDAASLLGAAGAPRTRWWAAAWTLARLGLRFGPGAGAPLLPLARAYAAEDDPVARALGVRGLGALAPPPAPDAPESEAARFLVTQLGHPNEGVRVEALRALLRFLEAGGPPPEGAGEALLRNLADPLPAVRRESLRGLAAVPHEEAAEALLGQLGSGDRETRARALRAYHRQDEEGFFLLLSGWSDRDALARVHLVRELAAVPDARLRDFLSGMASDGDSRVRAAAFTALGDLEAALGERGTGPGEGEATPGEREAGTPGAEDRAGTLAILREALSGESVYERAAAAGAIRRLAPHLDRGETAELADTLETAFGEDRAIEPDFRLAALRAALALGEPANREDAGRRFAGQALADPAWPVRREAHQFLRRAGASPEAPPAPAEALPDADYDAMLHPPYTPVAWITTARGEIELELFIADAPRTVWNFMRLAREGFYDGLTFHRVVPNFVLQAGDPRADNSGGPGYTLRSEINERSFMRGSVGMATDGKDTGGSQFFLTLLPQPHLNGRYTLFAQVRRGFEVLDRIQPGDRLRRVRIWDGVIPPE